jgi:hypothetical protein
MPLSAGMPPAAETPIARMERIASADLPTLPGPPIDIPESPEKRREDIDRWKAMAQGYASLSIRQREFEDAIVREFKRNDARLSRIELMLHAIVVEADVEVKDPPESSVDFEPEGPTTERPSAHG